MCFEENEENVNLDFELEDEDLAIIMTLKREFLGIWGHSAEELCSEGDFIHETMISMINDLQNFDMVLWTIKKDLVTVDAEILSIIDD